MRRGLRTPIDASRLGASRLGAPSRARRRTCLYGAGGAHATARRWNCSNPRADTTYLDLLADLPAAELRSLGRGARHRGGALVLVAEDHAALLQVVGRHLDGDAVAGERLDAVLLHAAGGIGDDLVAIVEQDPIARVRKDFRHHAFELDQLFLGHTRAPRGISRRG